MARYMERAEATARLLTMGQRMAILPGAHHRDEWRSVVRATGALNHFPEGAQVTESDAIAFLMLDHRSRSEEHTSELQSLMRISYAVFCLKKKTSKKKYIITNKIKTSSAHTKR